jgi:uncharacterized protein YutE (UPF0331/DUF86 family)
MLKFNIDHIRQIVGEVNLSLAKIENLSRVSEDEADKLKKMVKFRNILVHLYFKVDNKKVYEIMKKDIIDIRNYLKQIGKFIGESI